MSDIPEGYKMSEAGVIPVEWEVKTFGEVMTGFSSGATPYRGRQEYYKGNIRWITSGELNYNVITDTIEKITENAVRNTNLKIHPKGTFLMAITGLEAEGTRGSCGIVGAEATTNQSCMALFPTKELLTEYLFHYYVNYGNSLALEYCQGTKQQSYTAKIVKILPIIVPSTIEEQQAIASALSDVDALITALEQLITKKRNIKQGAMQQLLTGEKRLPGFGGKWCMMPLKNLIQVPVTDGPHLTPKFLQDGIPFLSVNNLVKNKIFLSNLRYISKHDHDIFSRKCKPQKEDILLGKAASVGLVAVVDLDFDFNIWSPIALIRLSNQHVPKFIYYSFQSRYVINQIKLFTNSSSQGNIGMGDIEEIDFLVPSKEEQQAIAEILSDMDTEIESLEQKRDKYKAIKQGMMQELLTGKTRLV